MKLQDQTLVRKFISQNGSGYTALSITNGSSYTDADPNSLQLKVYFNQADTANPGELLSQPPGTLIVTASADQITWVDTGHYSYDIGPPNTMYRGVLTMVWTYAVNGETFSFYDNAQILNQMPLYESLRDSERSVVEEVSWMLGDLFDSATGGPNLIEPFQTHFDYERLAQCEKRAVTRMNLIGFPVMYWGVGPDTQEVSHDFHGLLVLGTYLEVVRFLVASYTEIPSVSGVKHHIRRPARLPAEVEHDLDPGVARIRDVHQDGEAEAAEPGPGCAAGGRRHLRWQRLGHLPGGHLRLPGPLVAVLPGGTVDLMGLDEPQLGPGTVSGPLDAGNRWRRRA